MSNSDKDPAMNGDRNPVSGPKAMSRRSLLEGSVKAMPVVLTLYSGAALARSSNLISGTVAPEVDQHGRTLCLDTTSVDPAESPDLYDLGEPPYARVHAINERDYRVDRNNSSDPVSEASMCQSGGTYYYKEQGWKEVNLPKGMLVSGTALTSFAGVVDYVDL